VALSALFVLRVLGSVPRAIVPGASTSASRIAALRRRRRRAGTCAMLAWRGFGVWSLAADLLVATAVEACCSCTPAAGVRGSSCGARHCVSSPASAPTGPSRALNFGRSIDQLLIGKLQAPTRSGSTPARSAWQFPVMYVSRVIVGVLFLARAAAR
jgi:hypothetical protein